ncbi:MAG: hypothetical protein JXR61_10525 [Prolixibacteraceae bacterium]|nr:hypothetical protein [Prolixibacteraceae bacterium]
MKNGFLAILIIISQLAYSQINECSCFDGIGSSKNEKPSLTINFSNGIDLSICGYEEEKISKTEVIIREFDIFNCKTGESYITFGALQPCNLSSKTDTIVIKHLAPLPTGKNWKWQLTQVTQQIIYPHNDSIIITPQKCIYKKIDIEQNLTDQFFYELEQFKGKGYNKEMENLIGKLGVLTLNGNIKARNILNDFIVYMGGGVDGSNSETLNAVTSITNFECRVNDQIMK